MRESFFFFLVHDRFLSSVILSRNQKDPTTIVDGVVLRTQLTQQAMHDKCLLELQQRLDENVESDSKDGSYEVSSSTISTYSHNASDRCESIR